MIRHSDVLHADIYDILVILDACRYDTFKEIYKEYIPKDVILEPLVEANSEASETIYWLNRHWSDYYWDMCYVSGNPFINSFGVNCDKYHGNKHFHTIIDSWNHCFKKKTGRIEPACITKDAVKCFYPKYRNKKMIVHYMQPHSPYLFDTKICWWYEWARAHLPLKLFPRFIKRWVSGRYRREDVYSRLNCNIDVIKKAYKQNLRSVLPHVVNLVNQCGGLRVLVTSDHGEYLGEGGRFGHSGKNTKLINSVPFIIFRRD